MTDHLALWLRLHARREILAADAAWRRAMCWALGHDWRAMPFRKPVCVRCESIVDEAIEA